MDNLLVTYSAIVVALMTGLFSFLGLIISKENKVSEFRQAWIDALRADIAKFAAAASQLAQLRSFHDSNPTLQWQDFYKLIQQSLNDGSVAQTSILLRLNPYEDTTTTQTLVKKIKAVREEIKNENYDKAKDMAFALETVACPVLKHEWDRVKSGEPIYRYTKNIIAAAVVVLSLIGSFMYWSNSNQPQPSSFTNPYAAERHP